MWLLIYKIVASEEVGVQKSESVIKQHAHQTNERINKQSLVFDKMSFENT